MAEPNYNSALAGVGTRFPGAIPGGAAAPPQTISQEIQSLLPVPLAAGDKLATENAVNNIINSKLPVPLAVGDTLLTASAEATIRTADLAAKTAGGAPTASDKLLKASSMRAGSSFTPSLLNGFSTSYTACATTEAAIVIGLALSSPASVTIGTKICDLPFPCYTTHVRQGNGLLVYASGSALYAGDQIAGTTGNNFSFSALRA
jgi:hypothetical protein